MKTILLTIFFGVFLFGFAFFLEKKKQNYLKKFSKSFLIFGSILFTISLLEQSLILLEQFEKENLPPVPPFLRYFEEPGFFRIRNSILYVPAPNRNFRTFGYSFKTNSLGFREKEF
ncbi:MAG: hypothetical protein VYC17_02805 [Nitrospinota bacterium]|nr:hypothetical protein [Nitrospinota bacterium]